MIISIDRAMLDRNLLGAALGDLTPFNTWRVVMKAGFALALGDEERKIFDAISGNRPPPHRRVRELWCVIGRRGGKSRMAAAHGGLLGMLRPAIVWRPGEVGTVLVLAASRDQTRRCSTMRWHFCREPGAATGDREHDAQRDTPQARRRDCDPREQLRTVRGSTLVAVVMDEVAYWRDETSATPDVEVYRAVLPALATTSGMLIGISTPYRKVGLLYQKSRSLRPGQRHAGGARPQRHLQSEADAAADRAGHADDPEAAASEWQAEFAATSPPSCPTS